MSHPFVPRIGAVFSADIAVPDHERVVRFYSRVLSTGDQPLWREDDLMNNLGLPIIGLGELTAEYAELPRQWMPHIQVADVGASVERAVALGGRVLMQDEGGGQWAVLMDPDGAAFGVVPVVEAGAVGAQGEDVAGDVEAVGRISWLDLTVADAGRARDFYREVVGWSVQEVGMEDGEGRYADYAMLGGDGEAVAGVCWARGVNVGVPGVWLIYLTVGDVGESVRRVVEAGGGVVKRLGGDGGVVVRDLVGGVVVLV